MAVNRSAGNRFEKIFNYAVYLWLAFIIGLIILSPIFRGIYFEREWFVVKLAVFILFALWWMLRFDRSELTLAAHPIDYAALALGFFYLMSFLNAINPSAALAEFLKIAAYVALYILILSVIKASSSRERFTYIMLDALLIAGVIVALIGLAGASGALQLRGLFDGTRIHSTLQYHNANAVYLSAMFFLALGMAALQKIWYNRLPYLGAGLLFLIMVIFTYSRGAWLVLAVAIPIYIILSLPGQRLKNALFLLLTLIIALISINQLETFIAAKQAAVAFIFLGGLIIIMIALACLIELYLPKIINKKSATLILLILITSSILLMPLVSEVKAGYLPATPTQQLEVAAPASRPADAFMDRVSEIDLETHSATERFIYYRVALRIAADYYFLGAGGGAWGALYLDYLGEDFHDDFVFTVEVHNHYLKILIEAGLPGLLSFLALLFFFGMGFLRCRFSKETDSKDKQLYLALFMPALVICAHSAIDFGLSLGAISIFLWILLALGRAQLPDCPLPLLSGLSDKMGSKGQKLINFFGLAFSIGLIILTLYIY